MNLLSPTSPSLRPVAGPPATQPTVPPVHAPHGPREPGSQPEPGTLPPQIHDPDPADIPEIIDPESPQHPRLRGRPVPRRAVASGPCVS